MLNLMVTIISMAVGVFLHGLLMTFFIAWNYVAMNNEGLKDSDKQMMKWVGSAGVIVTLIHLAYYLAISISTF